MVPQPGLCALTCMLQRAIQLLQMQSLLRYGLVRKGGVFRAWQTACIDELERSGLAQLCCIIDAASSPNDNAFERYRSSQHLPSQARMDRDFDGVSIVECRDAEQQNLDFILSFGDKSDVAELIDAARYGVWSFGPEVAGFWEIYYGTGVTCATLVKLQHRSNGNIVLKRGCFSTIRESFRQNAEQLFSEFPTWPVQVCRDIASGVAQYFEDAVELAVPERYHTPSALQIALMRAQEKKNAVKRYLTIQLFSIDWSVFALKGSPADYIGRDARADVSSLGEYRKEAFLADPCVVKRNGSTYVFCEEYSRQYNRGRIVAFELNGEKQPRPRTAIDEPYHLSFPQVFEHDGEMYCIAESAAVRSLGLYRAVEFPHRWKYVQTLLQNVRAVDTSILRYNGKWWLFFTSGKGPRSGDHSHLYIWYADDLFATWRPHAANPVKIDVRCARPAGPFFEHEGAIYRPTQDCSHTYGGAIRINRLDKLTEFEFNETVVGRIRPPAGPYSRGIHTLSCAGDWCIVDAKRYVFNPAGILTIAKDGVKALIRSNRMARSART